MRRQQPTATAYEEKHFLFLIGAFWSVKMSYYSDSDSESPQTHLLWWPRCACSAVLRGSLNCSTRCILIGVHQVELQKVHLHSFFCRPAQSQPFGGGLRCWTVWSEAASRWRLWWSRTTQCRLQAPLTVTHFSSGFGLLSKEDTLINVKIHDRKL